MDERCREDQLILYGQSFTSRLLLGTASLRFSFPPSRRSGDAYGVVAASGLRFQRFRSIILELASGEWADDPAQ